MYIDNFISISKNVKGIQNLNSLCSNKVSTWYHLPSFLFKKIPNCFKRIYFYIDLFLASTTYTYVRIYVHMFVHIYVVGGSA